MGIVEQGRASFEQRAWGEAFAKLSLADEQEALGPEDLDRLAQAAYLIGREEESVECWTRAHQGYLQRGDRQLAVRCAHWITFGLLHRGEEARAGGWLARAHRVLGDEECAERGLLLMFEGIQAIFGGDDEAAYGVFTEAAGIGERCGDPDLVALARHGQGRALIRLGRLDEGVACLDEVMVAVTSDEVSPIVAGDVYCGVIEGCHEIFDVGRAQEWTSALSEWCSSQPDLVLYRGQCLVHRSQMLQLHGAWPEAVEEALKACERLSTPPQPAVGDAFYQLGELHRLRGEFAEGQRAYREADARGRSPQPGLSLLHLAEGQPAKAEASIRRALNEARGRKDRAPLLPAFVEAALASGDVAAAREATEELTGFAEELAVPLLSARAAYAEGAVLLAEDDPDAALSALRRASGAFQELEAPYEAARARMEAGRCFRALGDKDTAEMDFDAARGLFEELGAKPDLDRLDELRRPSAAPAGLTEREVEVLGLVAEGKTNRAIAEGLVISEKTVARHVSNIFNKIGVSSRAAATAYAYEHDLVTT